VAIFPNNNVGLELACVIMIFTGQVWNMTFSFYQSLRSIPQYLLEAASVYRFNWFAKAVKLEIPFSAIGLIWNSMMSMAGGWFFLTVTEAFQLGDKDFRLPGLGSYMSVANDKGDDVARFWGVVAMIVMIVFLDQFLWRPLVVWGQKFRVEEGGAEESMHSWFLDFLNQSQILLRETLRLQTSFRGPQHSWYGHAAAPVGSGDQAGRPAVAPQAGFDPLFHNAGRFHGFWWLENHRAFLPSYFGQMGINPPGGRGHSGPGLDRRGPFSGMDHSGGALDRVVAPAFPGFTAIRPGGGFFPGPHALRFRHHPHENGGDRLKLGRRRPDALGRPMVYPF
jgi:hypothetical protein